MDYITKPQLEQYLGLSIDSTLDAFLNTVSAFAKQYIDESVSTDFARRWFDGSATGTTRYFNGNDTFRLYVDDLRTITTVEVDGTALTINEDFYAYPLNAAADNKPYEYIELVNPNSSLNTNSRMTVSGRSPFVFDMGQRNIAITGKWGYNETGDAFFPPLVKMAALKLCGSVIKENIGDTDLKEITSETLGEYSASYAKVKDIADRLEVSAMLAPLVRQKVGGKGATAGMRVAS